ncbi:MAG: 30S ribosomal protein S4 [Chitinophagales bacterium]|nr:30S ribosomal protein S4 [Chitinophagales bacterium]
MARYTGPVTKIARRFGEPIFGFDKYFDKRNYPPGQHGPSKRRRQASEYKLQLNEKQKAKYTYGLLERQFARMFDKANRQQGATGENLLKLLESRLDNLVFRMGFARTRRQARQLVNHKHVLVNGQILSVPSAILKPGDVVTIREKSKSLDLISDAIGLRVKDYGWVEFNGDKLEGKYLNVPEREEIPENIKEQLIVELYSK